MIDEGLAVKTGSHRIGMLMDREGRSAMEYAYDWRGRESGYAGPTVMQRIPNFKRERDSEDLRAAPQGAVQ